MFRRILKWVLWSTGLLLIMFLLVAAGLFFAPNVVSTDWFRNQVETRASQTLHRAVTIGALRWTWREGIRITGLEVLDAPRYGSKPILSVDRLLVFVDFELSPSRLLMDLKAHGLGANLIREKDGRTNLEAWLAQLKSPSKPSEPIREAPAPKAPSVPFILPGDLTAIIELTDARMRMEDRMENRLLQIRDGALTLNIPSLLSEPLTLTINSTPSLEEKDLPPLDLSVRVDGLVNDSGSLDPKAAMLHVKGELPGLHVALEGSMAQKGLNGKVNIDLAPLMEAVKPLIPATLPRLSGRIQLQTEAKLKTKDIIVFDAALACDNMLASGGPLKEKEIGPFSISLSQKGNAALHDKIVTLAGGDIHLLKKSGLSFKGRMKLEAENRVNVDLTLDKVALHLGEIQALAEGFIPEGVQLKGMNHAQRPDVTIREVQLSGILPHGRANLIVEDLALNLSRLRMPLSKEPLEVEDVTLSVPRVTVRLKDRFPKALAMGLSMGARNVRISGKQPLSMDECRISSLRVTIEDLVQSPEALWGVAGQVTFQESGVFRGVRLPPRNDGTDQLSHGFKAHVDLPAAPRAVLAFAETDLSLASLKLSSILPHPLKEGLALKGRLKDARITQLNPFKLDVAHWEADVDSRDVLALHIQGSALDSGMKSFETEGRMSMDLGRALNLAPAGLFPKGKFTGRVKTKWRLRGRRPAEKEMAGLTDQTLSLEKRMGNTRFLEQLEIETEFLQLGAVLPLPSGETLSARGINSKTPFRISTANGLTSFSMAGELNVGHIEGLTSLKKLKDPLGAVLSFNAVSRNLNSLELRETLQLAPLGVAQHLDLSLNKLNGLLRQREKPDLTTLLKTVEAKIEAGININTGPGLAPFTLGATLEGPLKGGLALRLRGGKSISVKASLESDGINGAMPNKFSISNLKTHLHFDKTYGLKFGPVKEKAVESAEVLSRWVLQPKASPGLKSSGPNPLSQRVLEDLRGRLSGKPTLAFAECRLETGRFPVRLKNAQMQLRFSRSLPSVDYFQMGVMGGTVLGALRILEHGKQYRLEMTGDFSGLDANRLLRGRSGPPNEKEIPGESRISGRMSLRVPITAQAGTVMGNLDAVFSLTHIGARTLERLLYAMDPHENNESIVRQRALLKKGTPRWIEVVIRNGSLSLTGEVALGGTTLQLPAIKRLNVTSLPIRKRIQTLADRLVPLLKGFKILSANTLWVEPDGAIDFREDGK